MPRDFHLEKLEIGCENTPTMNPGDPDITPPFIECP
jgi:hypothetical protein